MRIGICQSDTSATVCRQAGADFIEQNVQELLRPLDDEAAVAARFRAVAGAALPTLVANCFLPGNLKCVGPAMDLPGIGRYAEVAFRRAAQVGIQLIVFGSGGARAVPAGFSREEAFQQLVAVNRQIAPLAERHGVTIVIEPLNTGECNFINSLADGAAVVAAVQHQSVRLLADIYHMLRDNEPAEEIRRFGHLLRHVHIAEQAKRTAPGVAGDDFGPYLQALKTANYRGDIALECTWGNFAAELPVAITDLRRQLTAAGC